MAKYTRIKNVVRDEFHPDGSLAALERILHIYIGDDGNLVDLAAMGWNMEADKNSDRSGKGGKAKT